METTANTPEPVFVAEIGRGQLIGASISTGVLGFMVGSLLFYFKAGKQGWITLLAQAGALGLLVAVITYLRCGARRRRRIAVDQAGIQIESEKERLSLPWSEIDGISHWVHGDHYWEFRFPNQPRPVVLKGFGFEVNQCEQLSEAIRRFKPIVEEEPGLKRILQDAFVH
jgi:hypothetical protein